MPSSPWSRAWLYRLTLPFLLSALTAASAKGQSLPLHLPSATGGDSLQTVLGEANADSAPALTHLTVGHLLYLRSTKRIRRVYVANPETLSSYTVNPHQIVFTAKGAGLTSVGVWDEDDHVTTYTISADVPVQQLKDALSRAYPGIELEVSASEGHVLLSGTVPTTAVAEGVAKLAGSYAKDVVNSLVISSSRIKQVRLQVRIVEVDRSKLTQFGINLFNPGGGSTLAVGSASQFPTSVSLSSGSSASGSNSGTVGGNTLTYSDPLNFLFYSATANLGITIRDLESKQILQVLAEPTITTMSGQKASFLAGGEFPFPVVQGSSGGLTSITVQFRSYGVKLDFLPEVNADGSIALKVMPEVSALDYTNSVTISGYTIPAISTRHADTQVVLSSGQSFAISGLLDKRTTDVLSRTPGIAKIPLLGQLFKSKNVNLSTSELIVIVTPTLVDPLHEQVPATEPKPVRPFLNPPAFDSGLPGTTGGRR